MINHKYTEPTEINFSKLEERILNINNPSVGKYNDVREFLYFLTINNEPTLIISTGGSKTVAYYLQLIIERMGITGSICEVIEPRDYFYKANKNQFKNLVVISASGKTNGVSEILKDFKNNKYLITEEKKEEDTEVISWGNKLYDSEKSFISLATTLGPISLLLDSTTSLNLELTSEEIERINDKIRKLIIKSKDKINNLDIDFKDTSLIQIISGYETKASSYLLESNLIEVGIMPVVVHDKGSFCHGRSNLLFRYPDSKVIYLTHGKSKLDSLITELIESEYSNISIFDTSDLDENIFWKEFYLILQMFYLSKKIADDKEIDLTMPEYNPVLVKSLYNFKGEM